MAETILLYTDGACSGNPGPGGWGVVLLWQQHRKELCGGEVDTTNNRMELTAVIKGLEALRDADHPVEIVTDSRYVKDGIEQWLPRWKANRWRTASKKAVKNRDLWEALEAALRPYTVRWRWVKGHGDDPLNERADALARQGIDQIPPSHPSSSLV